MKNKQRIAVWRMKTQNENYYTCERKNDGLDVYEEELFSIAENQYCGASYSNYAFPLLPVIWLRVYRSAHSERQSFSSYDINCHLHDGISNSLGVSFSPCFRVANCFTLAMFFANEFPRS